MTIRGRVLLLLMAMATVSPARAQTPAPTPAAPAAAPTQPAPAPTGPAYVVTYFEVAPAGFSYATFKLEDGVSFLHVSVDLVDDRPNPLAELQAFLEFTGGVGERCDEPPVTSRATEIGSYEAFSPR